MAARLYSEIEIETIPDGDADTSYLEQVEFIDRLAEYQAGDFGFIGIRASCQIVVGSTVQTIKSPGLWGIEDDSDTSYLEEVAEEEREELRIILREMGVEDSTVVEP